MNNQASFLDLLLGGQSLMHLGAMLLFCLFAATFSLLTHSTTRDVNSPNTPRKFSWVFLYEHNIKRCIVSLMAILIYLRFAPEIPIPVIGGEVTPFKALMAGFGLDKLVEWLKARASFLQNALPTQKPAA